MYILQARNFPYRQQFINNETCRKNFTAKIYICPVNLSSSHSKKKSKKNKIKHV